MAINCNGGNNPTAVTYNGKNCTEVWYKSSPGATAIKVWPDDILDKYAFTFPTELFQDTSWISTYTLGVDETLTLPSNKSEKGYPITSTATGWTVHFNGNNVKTFADVTATRKTTTTSIVYKYSLKYKKGSSYLYVKDNSGSYYNSPTSLPATYTVPSSGFNKTTYPEPYYFVPSFTKSTKTTTSPITLPNPGIVNLYRFKHWLDPYGKTHTGGSTYTPQVDGETLEAIWYEPVTITYSGFYDGVGLLINGSEYKNSSGSVRMPYKGDLYVKQFTESSGNILTEVYNATGSWSSYEGKVQYIGDKVNVSRLAIEDLTITMSSGENRRVTIN